MTNRTDVLKTCQYKLPSREGETLERLYKDLIETQDLGNLLWRKFERQPGDGWLPLPLRTLIPAKELFTAPVCMATVWRCLWMCRAIGWLLAQELLLLLRQEVAQPQAECSGRTQPSHSVPCSGLVSPWVMLPSGLATCAPPWRVWTP